MVTGSRIRRSEVRDADEMALDFEISRDEWINRLVHLGGLTRRDAVEHVRVVADSGGSNDTPGAGVAPAYRLAQRRVTEAM
jgi:hypothetical protein